MVFNLKGKERGEKKEASRQFEPRGHLSMGGPHACTLTDNVGWEERRKLEEGRRSSTQRERETSVVVGESSKNLPTNRSMFNYSVYMPSVDRV